ncbi:hypothetical protein CR513_13533, partial [Mucuna pruriens]
MGRASTHSRKPLHSNLIPIRHSPFVDNASTSFPYDIILLQAMQNIIHSEVQALERGQLPRTSLTGLLRSSLEYCRHGKGNGTCKQANNKYQLQRRGESLHMRLVSTIGNPILASTQIGPTQVRVPQERGVVEVAELTSARHQTRQIPPNLRRDPTREHVAIEKELLHAGEVTNGGRQSPRKLVVRESNLTKITRNRISLRKLAGEIVILKLNLRQFRKSKKSFRNGPIQKILSHSNPVQGFTVPERIRNWAEKEIPESYESLKCVPRTEINNGEFSILSQTLGNATREVVLPQLHHLQNRKLRYKLRYRSVELVPEQVQKRNILQLAETRRNLAGQHVVGQIHRFQTLQVPQLRRQRPRQRIHLKEQRVQLLQPPQLRRNLAGQPAVRGVEPHQLRQVPDLRRNAAGIGVVVADVELPEAGDVPDLRRDSPIELVAGDGEVLEAAPASVLRRDLAGEEVAAEMQVAEVGHVRDGERERAAHVVVVEVEHLEVLEARELRGEGFIEDIVGEVEEAEGSNGGKRRGDGAGELVGGEGEVGKEWEVGDVGGEGAGEVEAGEVEGDDVAAGVAGDAKPGAVRCGGIPRRQNRRGGIGNC